MTFNDTLGDVQTLAHELGHAYHNWVLRGERPLNLLCPTTLAETASTFAETLLTDSRLSSPDTSAQLRAIILNTRLDRAVAGMLNIPCRFDFERKFYEERGQGEVSQSRLKELMLEAQRGCYGDTLNPNEKIPTSGPASCIFTSPRSAFTTSPTSSVTFLAWDSTLEPAKKDISSAARVPGAPGRFLEGPKALAPRTTRAGHPPCFGRDFQSSSGGCWTV